MTLAIFVLAFALSRDAQKSASQVHSLSCLRTIEPHAGAVHDLAFDPKGERVAIACDDGRVLVCEVASGAVVRELRVDAGQVCDVEFNAPGDRLLAVQFGATHVWNTQSFAEVATLRGQKLAMLRARFSPDGLRIVTDSAGNGAKPDEGTEARVWDANTGELIATIEDQAFRVTASFRPDGAALLVSSEHKHEAVVFDLEHKRVIHKLPADADGICFNDWSSDGKVLATLSLDGTGYLWNATSGAKIAELRGHEGYPLACEFNLAGNELLTTSWQDRTSRVWNVKTGKLRWVLSGHDERITGAHFSPDGRAVASVDAAGRGCLFDLEKGALFAHFADHTALISSVQFTHDSRRIGTASHDGTVRLWGNPLAK